MASKKDMRTVDLSMSFLLNVPAMPQSDRLAVIPYKDPAAKKETENDVASTMATTLPMVAVSEPLCRSYMPFCILYD